MRVPSILIERSNQFPVAGTKIATRVMRTKLIGLIPSGYTRNCTEYTLNITTFDSKNTPISHGTKFSHQGVRALINKGREFQTSNPAVIFWPSALIKMMVVSRSRFVESYVTGTPPLPPFPDVPRMEWFPTFDLP